MAFNINMLNFVVSIHDMWIPGENDGDTDDWVAVFAAMIKRDIVVYVPGSRFHRVQDFIQKHGIDINLIGPGHPESDWCVTNATSICKCAPLTIDDKPLVDAIRRRTDNTSNSAQGQTFDPSVKEPNFNFKATMNNLGISKEELDILFPHQYVSDLTKQCCPSLVQSLPPVIQGLVSSFAVLKVVCPPPAHLPYAIGLLDPTKGKGSNANECMKMLRNSTSAVVIEESDTPTFFKNLVDHFHLNIHTDMITSYVTLSKTDNQIVLANALAGIIHLAQQCVIVNDEPMYYSSNQFARLSDIKNVHSKAVVDPPLYDAVALLACLAGYTAQQFKDEKPSIQFLLDK